MSTGIFIKTWESDIPWLKYCLKSIEKYCMDIDDIVIVSDKSCTAKVMEAAPGIRIQEVPDWHNGYIQQQWVKLNADLYLETDYVLFVDSDCLFTTEFSPELLERDGKPILLKTKYGNLGDGEVWKGITEGIVCWPVNFEYMRRMPLMYHRDSLSNFRNRFPELVFTLQSMKTRAFSEFNALGAYIDRLERSRYYITDTDDWIPESVARQFWSWGGITPEVQLEINSILGL